MPTKLLTRVGQFAYLRENASPGGAAYLESPDGDAAKIPGLKTFADAAADYDWGGFTTALALEEPGGRYFTVILAEWNDPEQRFEVVSTLAGGLPTYGALRRVYATMTEETIAAFIAETYA